MASPVAAPISGPRAARRGVHSEGALTVVLGVAALAVVAGVWIRTTEPGVEATLPGVVGVLRDQLPTTLPAALAVSAVVALDVCAGATLLRLLIGRPWPSLADAILGGFAGAILLDVFLLYLLGGFGLFRGPIVVAALGLAASFATWALRRRLPPAASARRLPGDLRRVRWLRVPLVALMWAGPIVFALASPVVPFSDVLPNHVAPAAHLLAFGGISSLATDPSPIYGAARLFQGEIALLGTVTVATGVAAPLAMAAFAPTVTFVSGVAMWKAATAAFGRRAGYWALVMFPLSFTFARLPDARDSVTALPIVAFAFSLLTRPDREWARLRPTDGRPDWALAVALLATVLVHPLVGALATGTILVVAASQPTRYAARVVPGVAGVVVAALPQAAVMLGFAVPPVLGIAALAGGAAVAVQVTRHRDRVTIAVRSQLARIRMRGRVVGALLVATGLVGVAMLAAAGIPARVTADLRLGFPVLFGLAACAALGLVPSARGGRRTLLAGAGVGLVALTIVELLPGSSLSLASLRYEIPKAVGYWLPWVAVPAAAGALAAIWRLPLPALGRLGLVGAVVAAAVLPVGPIVPNTMQAEHPASDSLAFDLHTAQVGYWVGYPDRRQVVDAAQREVVARISLLEATGAWRADDVVLHVAASYLSWRSIPVAPFTGAMETIVAGDAQPTIFTTGLNLLPVAAFTSQLSLRPRFVLLEPAGVSASLATQIAAAGYRTIFADSIAVLYQRS